MVAGIAEEVVGVEVALLPALLRALGELPVVEARAEALPDRLMLLRPVVVAQAVIGQAKRFGEYPPLTVVLISERVDASRHVPAAGFDLIVEIVEGNQR